MIGARLISGAVVRVLLDAVGEGLLAPGVAAVLAARIGDDVALDDCARDDLLELSALGSRT